MAAGGNFSEVCQGKTKRRSVRCDEMPNRKKIRGQRGPDITKHFSDAAAGKIIMHPVQEKENLLASLPDASSEEITRTLLKMKSARIEYIVSQGQASPVGYWYDQTEDEWVLLLQGSAILGYADGREIQLAAGDSLMIPAHVKHRVVQTDKMEKTVWLAIFGSVENI